MSDISEEVLSEVTIQVFEEAAFVFLEKAETIDPWEGEMIEVVLDFQGPDKEGSLVLCASNEFAIELAANMLGMDNDDERVLDKGRAAIGEILNMICGILVERFFGSDVICKLGLPVTKEGDVETYAERMKSAQTHISFREEMGARIDAAMYL